MFTPAEYRVEVFPPAVITVRDEKDPSTWIPKWNAFPALSNFLLAAGVPIAAVPVYMAMLYKAGNNLQAPSNPKVVSEVIRRNINSVYRDFTILKDLELIKNQHMGTYLFNQWDNIKSLVPEEEYPKLSTVFET